MGVDAKLLPGGIVHVHFEKDGVAHGVDVWDSVEAYEQFVQSMQMPAMGKGCRGKRPRPVKDGRTRSNDHRGPSPRLLASDPGRTHCLEHATNSLICAAQGQLAIKPRCPSGRGNLKEGDDQVPHAPEVTVTSTVVADGSLVTTSRVAPTADVALPPVTLAQ
jgi:hypothetical protein